MKKIVLIGGGSKAWAPNIVKDMLLTETIRDAEFVLYDLDREAAEFVRRVLERVNGELRTSARFTATDHREAAFEGADYFIITLSTGGLDAMAKDLSIPEDYGIYHTVGDTSGPGGWARCIRNFEVFTDLAEAINRQAPAAMILNYTNPMTTLTQVLCRMCEGPVIGLCHGLFENLSFLKRFYEVESEDQISVEYAGVNHFFWITKARANGVDVIADLNARLEKHSFTDLLRESAPDPMGFKSNRELATELARLTGVMPYLGDRHTCEFLPGYITSPSNMEKYKLVRTSIEERHKNRRETALELETMIQSGVDKRMLQRSRETAADIIAAHVRGVPFIDVGNLPNRGQVSNLPMGAVVETAVRVDQNGFAPIAFGALPAPIAALVEPYAHVFDLLVDACFNRNRRQALQALRMDPVCSHLNAEEVHAMGTRLLQAHEKFITLF